MRNATVDARPDAFLPLPPRDYLILLALFDEPLHGHGLLKAVEAQAGGVFFDPANLYRLLRKLERDVLVEEVPQTRRSGPVDERRRQYTLTPLGRNVLAAESTRLARLADAARARKLAPQSRGAR